MTNTPPSTEGTECLFVTMGMLVMDKIYFHGQPPKIDVIGGSGAYACLGARLHAPPPLSSRLGWLIPTGDDFPPTYADYFRSWNMLLLETRRHGKLSTRGELTYQDTTFGPKTFRYTTDPLKIEPNDLLNTPLLSSQTFHLLTSPSDATSQIEDLLKLRLSHGIEEPPIIIWEPAPPSCISQNLATCFEAMKAVDVFSPNHIELAALFGLDLRDDSQFDRSVIEDLAQKCLTRGIGSSKQGTIVIRAGHEGCCIYSRQQKKLVWLPPLYQESPKIVDPTGAGNAFLGGFATGLLETGDDVVAACYGAVAASFALEQIGLPVRESSTVFAADGTTKISELWNGDSVYGRLVEFASRVGIALANSRAAFVL